MGVDVYRWTFYVIVYGFILSCKIYCICCRDALLRIISLQLQCIRFLYFIKVLCSWQFTQASKYQNGLATNMNKIYESLAADSTHIYYMITMQARYTNELISPGANRPNTKDKHNLRQGSFVILTSSFNWHRNQYHYNEHDFSELPKLKEKCCHVHGCVDTDCVEVIRLERVTRDNHNMQFHGYDRNYKDLRHGQVISSRSIMRDAITYACPRLPILAPKSSYVYVNLPLCSRMIKMIVEYFCSKSVAVRLGTFDDNASVLWYT